jgi:cysteine desulfurase
MLYLKSAVMNKHPIYLDNQATTSVDSRVVESMLPFFSNTFGNQGSHFHRFGEDAAKAVDKARDSIANVIGARASSEVIFTSGATEANNLALQGALKGLIQQGRRHVITSAVEHKSVLDVFANLEAQELIEVSYLFPDQEGCFRLDAIDKAIRSDTGLLSFMFVNNEIGSINLIKDIGALARQRGIVFHCDAAQAAGKILIDVEALQIDLLTTSGHKIYGPKGVGVLYVRNSCQVEPIFYGGGQERGLRPGTLSVPLIVGFAKALEIADQEMDVDASQIGRLRDRLLKGLKDKISDVVINGSMATRIYNNLNVSFLGVKSDTLMMNLWNDIAVSNGSACSSVNWEGSYVLKAMGLSSARINSAIRFGLGRMTTQDEIDMAVELIITAVKKLKS